MLDKIAFTLDYSESAKDNKFHALTKSLAKHEKERTNRLMNKILDTHAH